MSRFDALIGDIKELAQPLCDEMGLEIIEVKVNPHHDLVNLQIVADKLQGGIGMEECARLNRALARKLDEDGRLGDDYTLEVASPGIDRPLVGARELRRALGRDVQVFLKERFNGKCEFSGRLTAVNDEGIILGTCKGEMILPMDKIEKTKQIIN